MWNMPNILSLLRLPLALLFVQQNLPMRTAVLFLAMVSDVLDGFVARRFKQTSRLGTLLDPLMDKFFVAVVLVTLFSESKISFFAALSLLSRDIAVFLYGLFLIARSRLTSYELRAIWCGKITTSLQFVLFLSLLYGFSPSPVIYGLFIALGCFALVELYLFEERSSGEKKENGQPSEKKVTSSQIRR